MKRRQLPKYVSAFCDRHGKERLRFRRTGAPSGYFTAAPPSRAFWDEYEAFMADIPPEPKPAHVIREGSIEALLVRYYRSTDFRGRASDVSIAKRRAVLADAEGRGREAQRDDYHQQLLAADAQIREEAANRRNGALVYFIQAGDGGPIKIGLAADVQSRLRSLQTSHHAKLALLATAAGGSKVERAYHKQFADHRHEGEWFSPHPDILAEIDRLKGIAKQEKA